MTEVGLDKYLVVEGPPAGRLVARVGDPARQTVFTFIKGEDGGNYAGRRGPCSCCQEVQEDWLRFDSWEDLAPYFPEKNWLYEMIARQMCGPAETLH